MTRKPERRPAPAVRRHRLRQRARTIAARPKNPRMTPLLAARACCAAAPIARGCAPALEARPFRPGVPARP